MKAIHKTELKELALFGGEPAFPEKLHVGRPNVGDRSKLLERLNDILDRRWFTNNGHYVQEFERKVCDMVGVKHCIATCNATIALEIAIRALDLKGEVIVPSFTFVASPHSLQWQEITPVFADIDPRTHTIDPASVERLLTPRTTGIMGVQLWGQPCRIEELEQIASRHKLKLLFDASHAFGCTYRDRKIGTFGDCEIFSFHATKFVNSLEGGAIVTNDDDLARKIRLMTNFGFLGYDNVGYVGTNGKQNEFSAAMGITSLECMDEIIALNHRNHDCYARHLAGIPGIRLLRYDPQNKINYQYVVAEVDPVTCPVSRDNLLSFLWSENVLARRYFYPGCHRMMPYRAYFPNAGLLLPETDKVSQKILVLPTGQTVSEEMVASICDVIRLAVANPAEVTQRVSNWAERPIK